MKQVIPTKVITGKVRLSYVHLTKPYANQPNQDPKFSTTLLIPKSDIATKRNIDAAIQAATQRPFSSAGRIPTSASRAIKPSIPK